MLEDEKKKETGKFWNNESGSEQCKRLILKMLS